MSSVRPFARPLLTAVVALLTALLVTGLLAGCGLPTALGSHESGPPPAAAPPTTPRVALTDASCPGILTAQLVAPLVSDARRQPTRLDTKGDLHPVDGGCRMGSPVDGAALALLYGAEPLASFRATMARTVAQGDGGNQISVVPLPQLGPDAYLLTFYEATSLVAELYWHAGSQTLELEFVKLTDQQPVTDQLVTMVKQVMAGVTV